MMHASVTRIGFWLSIIHLASVLFAAPEGPWFSPLGMMHSPGFDGNSSLSLQMLMNADSLYTAAHCALLLNLKLSHGDYYRKRPTLAPGMMVSVCSLLGPSEDQQWPLGRKAECERDGTGRCVPHCSGMGHAGGAVEGEVMRFAHRCEMLLPTLLQRVQDPECLEMATCQWPSNFTWWHY